MIAAAPVRDASSSRRPVSGAVRGSATSAALEVAAERYVSASTPLMGGTVQVTAVVAAGGDAAFTIAIEREARRVLRRIEAWADGLTRFDASSELSRLNTDPRRSVSVGPTLAAVIDWGRAAEVLTDGIVDIAMLDARLAAEAGDMDATGRDRAATPRLHVRPSSGSRSWSLARGPRRTVVVRPPGLRLDLDGVAKGWIADRALELVAAGRTALVDADGDIAIVVWPGESVEVAVADPRTPGARLAVLRLTGDPGAAPTRLGIATSGTSVHRWPRRPDGPAGPAPTHHLIDPSTGRPAQTDVVQATVLARSARTAEAFAKAAVIVGSAAALRLLDREAVQGAILLTEAGEVLALPSTARWLS